MKLLLGLFSIAIFSIGTLSILSSCGTTSASVSNNNYAGPGSHWEINLNGITGRWSATRYDSKGGTQTQFSAGSYSQLSNGFLKLTVDNTDGAPSGADGPALGDTTYALEVPGMAMLMKPWSTMTTNKKLIAAVSSGACPTADQDIRWITTRNDGGNATTGDFYGTFNYNATTGNANLPARYALGNQGVNIGANNIGTATCSSGTMTIGNVLMYLTSSGGAIVNTDTSNSANAAFIIGLPKTTVTASDLDGTYYGLLFDGSSDEVQPVRGVFSNSGTTLNGRDFTDFENNVVSGTDAVTGTFTAPDSDGFINGTLTQVSDSNTGKMSCAPVVNANSTGKNMMYCVGQDMSDNTKHYNLLLVKPAS